MNKLSQQLLLYGEPVKEAITRLIMDGSCAIRCLLAVSEIAQGPGCVKQVLLLYAVLSRQLL